MVSVDHLNEIVLGEIVMMVDCWLFVSFVGCLESCVVVGTVDFVGYCNCDFVYSGLFVVVWSDRVVPQGFLQVGLLIL